MSNKIVGVGLHCGEDYRDSIAIRLDHRDRLCIEVNDRSTGKNSRTARAILTREQMATIGRALLILSEEGKDLNDVPNKGFSNTTMRA